MARWVPQSLFDHGPYHITAGIDTARYSIFFNLDPAGGGYAYCRVGQNSFSDKGRAMRSTLCLRQNEVRMIEDNLSSLSPYEANPAWFSKDTYTFPADGGWYWPVSSVSEDQISLHGCNGETYTISRRKA